MAPARTIDIPASGVEARHQCRLNAWDAPTAGIASGYLQANLIVLPSRYAADFAILCARNPVPCPLLATSASPGDFKSFTSHIPGIPGEKIASGIDIRTDISRYHVYNDGELIESQIPNIESQWDLTDHVAFLIGCSFSFDNALAAAGFTPPHMVWERNVAIYRTNIPLCPAGVFKGSNYVVSMRLYRASDVERVRDITRPYVTTHGEPVTWGWDGARSIGIDDIHKIDWGDAPITPDGLPVVQIEEERKEDGLVPVFFGCGVTPQEVISKAKIPGTVMGHSPGYMLVLDLKDSDVIKS